jgi:acetoin utilization deacetylase AcuC-like enzyme
MELDADGYAWMTRRLLETARRGPGHRIGFLLEGGYDLTGVRESVQHTLGALFEEPPALERGEGLSTQHEAELAAAMRVQRQYWRL